MLHCDFVHFPPLHFGTFDSLKQTSLFYMTDPYPCSLSKRSQSCRSIWSCSPSVPTITVSVYHISSAAAAQSVASFRGNEHIFFSFSFFSGRRGRRQRCCGLLSGRNVVYWELVAFWRVGGLPARSLGLPGFLPRPPRWMKLRGIKMLICCRGAKKEEQESGRVRACVSALQKGAKMDKQIAGAMSPRNSSD